jgi:hypothetical protein
MNLIKNNKMISILGIILIIFSNLSYLILIDSFSKYAEGKSVWSQSSFIDFKDGTLNNTTIMGIDENAELRIDFSNINEWTDNMPAFYPEARGGHAMASIYGDDKVVLFGGTTKFIKFCRNDTWVYDLSDNNWVNNTMINAPGLRASHAMVPIFGDDKIILFGGICWKIGNYYYNDTWEYDLSNNTWTEKKSNGIKPINRYSHAMAPIWNSKKILLFGGGNDNKYFNDTWVYDSGNDSWINMTPFIKPGNYPNFRIGHAMASISGDDKVVMFGGGAPSFDCYNDTWVYDLSENNWTKKTTNITPSLRMDHAMASIYGDDKVILFGGNPWTKLYYNDSWVYDLTDNTWTKIHPFNSSLQPNGRNGPEMTSIYGTDQALLFGGTKNDTLMDYYNDTWVYKQNLPLRNGTYTSSIYNTNANCSFKSFNWSAEIPNNTFIKFQLRTGQNENELLSKAFVGPDGTESSLYFNSPSTIWSGHNGDRVIQCKIYFNIDIFTTLLSLKEFTIDYNKLPDALPIYPNNGYKISTNKPTFKWYFKDSDSVHQEAVQVLISDNIDFNFENYDTGQLNFSEETWDFPNGTGYMVIPDGTWYWKIRCKDSDGDWGPYSTPFKFTIDTEIPYSEIIIPKNNTYYKTFEIIYGTALEPPGGTGLEKVEIQIEDVAKHKFWDGSGFSPLESWLIPDGKEIWSYDTRKIEWTSGTSYRIRSRAVDIAGNIESPAQTKVFTFDDEGVLFSDPVPVSDHVSSIENVHVGINISDNTSGVNASTIKYSTSTNAGNYWSSWKSVDRYNNNKSIDVKLNLTFPNGTGNRIRWRAYDIAGNGPTYSDDYVINVNIPKPPIIPEIKLVSPLNNSKITTTSVRLSWEIIKNYHPSIEFDIKLGTINPPQNVIEQDYINTDLNVDQLENGKTYFWTVIPKLINTNGTCISGTWSFTVDIPLPRAILKTPENNSIITSRLPTLVWSLDYDGTETVTYDVYFGTNKDPPLEFEKLTITYYAIDTALQDNITYYWKIVPRIGEYEGLSSEVWSFTVKLKEDEKIPKFGIELDLNPNLLEIKPGEVKFVSAIVTNLGDLNDNITVKIGEINNTKLTIENYRQDTLEIEPGKNKEFLIMISMEDNNKLGFENITITATSRLAEKYNLHVQDSQMLSIKILEKDDQNEKERGQPISIFYFSILLLIIILIIISIIILIIVRKKSSKKDSEVEESQDIIPETSTERITTPEPETTVESLPVVTEQQDETNEE